VSYIAYTQSLQRNGYRPLGETNPFGATHLGRTPFDPMFLRGFPSGRHPYHGQHSASIFSYAGGRVLHQGLSGPNLVRRRGMGALGDMVPDQSVVTYQGTWQNTATQTANAVLQAVSAALTQDGFAVRNATLVPLSGIANALNLQQTSVLGLAEELTFNVTLQLQVNNGQGFADPNDIISIVRHEVYVATGQFPSADSIPTVQTPGATAPTPTGQPNVAGAPPPPGQTDWSAWFEQNAPWIALGVGALVLIPIAMGNL
jgi:hypothetical protein